jgi:hypothetical protein
MVVPFAESTIVLDDDRRIRAEDLDSIRLGKMMAGAAVAQKLTGSR